MAIHQVVHGFLVELFGDRGRIGQIGKQHRDDFALAFDGAAMAQNFVGQKFGGIIVKASEFPRQVSGVP
jgi:ABC-type molybdate transport system permease subunit